MIDEPPGDEPYTEAELDGVYITVADEEASQSLWICARCNHMFLVNVMGFAVASFEEGMHPTTEAELPDLLQSVKHEPERWIEVPGEAIASDLATTATCPRCGTQTSRGRSARTYRRIRRLRQVLGELSPDERAVAAEALARAQAGTTSPDEVAEELAASESTTLRNLAELFAGRGHHLAWLIMFVLAVLTYLEQREASHQDPPSVQVVEAQSTDEIRTMIDDAIADAIEQHPPPVPPPTQPVEATTTTVKVPRNAPCPCGSGAKFKKCHGA